MRIVGLTLLSIFHNLILSISSKTNVGWRLDHLNLITSINGVLMKKNDNSPWTTLNMKSQLWGTSAYFQCRRV